MTLRTFWRIFLKAIGIWIILESISILASFLLVFLSSQGKEIEYNFNYLTFLIQFILVSGGYFLVFRYFILKTDWLIDKLKLDKGFEEENLDVKIDPKNILTLAVIVLGGFLFVHSIPILFSELFLFSQGKEIFSENPGSHWIILYGIETTIGFLLMINYKPVVEFFTKTILKQEEINEN
jgi:hypothetical protein